MSREKQIEEMTVEFAKINCNPKGCFGCNLCDEYGSLELNCEDYLYYRTMAETFYNAGYRKQSEWISVEERLPENHRRVLIACDGTTIAGASPIAIGSYGGGFWSIADADGTAYLTKYMHVVVTHWMPLPEVPKMKGGAE